MASLNLNDSQVKSDSFDDDENTKKLRNEIFQLRLKCYDYSRMLDNCKCHKDNVESEQNVQMSNIMKNYHNVMNENLCLKEENERLNECWNNVGPRLDENIKELKDLVRATSEPVQSNSCNDVFSNILEFNNKLIEKYILSNRQIIKLSSKVKHLEKSVAMEKQKQNDGVISTTISELRKDLDFNGSLEISRNLSKQCPECDNYKVCYEQMSEQVIKVVYSNQKLSDEVNQNKIRINQLQYEIANNQPIAQNDDLTKLKKYIMSVVEKLAKYQEDKNDLNKLVEYYINELGIITKENEKIMRIMKDVFCKLSDVGKTVIDLMKIISQSGITEDMKKLEELIAKKKPNLIFEMIILINKLAQLVMRKLKINLQSVSLQSVEGVDIQTKKVLEERSYEAINQIHNTLGEIKNIPSNIRNISPQHIKTIEQSNLSVNDTFCSSVSEFSNTSEIQMSYLDNVCVKLENLGNVIKDYVKQVEVVDLNKTLEGNIQKTNSSTGADQASSGDNRNNEKSTELDISFSQERLLELYNKEKEFYNEEIRKYKLKADEALELKKELESIEQEKYKVTLFLEEVKCKAEIGVSKLEEMKNINKNLKIENKNLSGKIGKIQVELCETIEKYSNLQSEITANCKMNDELNQLLIKSQNEKEIISSELQSLSYVNNNLQQNLVDCKNENNDLNSKIVGLTTNIESLNMEVGKINDALLSQDDIINDLSLNFIKVYQKFLYSNGWCEDDEINMSFVKMLDVNTVINDFLEILGHLNKENRQSSDLNANNDHLELSIHKLKSVEIINSQTSSTLKDDSSKSTTRKINSSNNTSDLKSKCERYSKKIKKLENKLSQKHDSMVVTKDKIRDFERKLEVYTSELTRCKQHLTKALRYLPPELIIETNELLE